MNYFNTTTRLKKASEELSKTRDKIKKEGVKAYLLQFLEAKMVVALFYVLIFLVIFGVFLFVLLKMVFVSLGKPFIVFQ
jgi:hypothetical protein